MDWAAVQRFYDAGHTREQCQERFGFSKGAWRSAKLGGLVKPRVPGTQVGPNATRTKVSALLARDWSYNQIANELGIAKSTVAFHARRLGRPVDDRFNVRYDWPAIQRAHDRGMRAMQCARHFGFSRAIWSVAVKRGDIVPRSHLIPLEELLVRGRRTSRNHLKKRLVSAGLKGTSCERCGIDEWEGSPLSIQLHHVNGVKDDNRLENLELLCPNCHSQTENWGGRNKVDRPVLRLVKPLPDDDEGAESG
jgi:hypothetical protein